MHLLGIDLGSSSVKVALVDADGGRVLANAQSPTDRELAIESPRPGWAEQDPELWWTHLEQALDALREQHALGEVRAIGISYQMHGLIVLDEAGEPLRPSIIWCDSRAVATGEVAARQLGLRAFETTTLNEPGNFTASKWAWVCEHEPRTLERARAVMLPGDYLAYRLTGERGTTASGLSEMILWDFAKRAPALHLLRHYRLSADLLPTLVPTFGDQGTLRAEVAQRFGLPATARVCYRAGDQPNNAYSLGVLDPGETAATAGTSGVVYAVTDERRFDRQQRVNTFAHVTDRAEAQRLGVLLCVNGTGSAYAWLRRTLGACGALPDYDRINAWAGEAVVGSDGPLFYPWGNGAERVLGNRDPGARVVGLAFNRHGPPELSAAVQDGVAAALAYGTRALADVGARPRVVRAGRANLFLSERFCRAFAELTGAPLELYDTDGAQGAARGAGVGAGAYATHAEALAGVHRVGVFAPGGPDADAYADLYARWTAGLSAAPAA